jgi:N-acetylneuraminic acid mutarotase
MALGRVTSTATRLPSGKVLVAGGLGTHAQLTSAEVYDPETSSWSSAGSMAEGRYQHTATLLNSGQVLVAGGFRNTDMVTLFSAEIHTP